MEGKKADRGRQNDGSIQAQEYDCTCIYMYIVCMCTCGVKDYPFYK